ncbi:MAG: 50S ribosomal protein L10, partial [Myxococcales bacterium]|nr:50S ribosomal protein L10 [Myxococcales bacterium]
MDSTTKRELSNKLRGQIEGVDALVLVGFSGLTVADANDLRTKFREAGCTYQVYKNSTIRFATQGTKHEPIKDLLSGVSGLAYNGDDPGAPARVAREFAKTHESFSVKGGVIDGSVLDERGVDTLADMPGPRELKAQLLALLNTPATQL